MPKSYGRLCPSNWYIFSNFTNFKGRTGRAGNSGTAVTFITPKEENMAPDLIKAFKLSG